MDDYSDDGEMLEERFELTPRRAKGWCDADGWTFDQAMQLLIGMDPALLPHWLEAARKDPRMQLPNQQSRVSFLLKAAVAKGVLVFPASPRDVVAWAKGKDIEVPLSLVKALQEAQAQEAVPTADAGQPSQTQESAPLVKVDPPSGPWPWGTYETPLLGHLAAAAEKFWKDFDPKTDVAPKSDEVEQFLRERGLDSDNMRRAIATILRPPDLKNGPRARKG